MSVQVSKKVEEQVKVTCTGCGSEDGPFLFYEVGADNHTIQFCRAPLADPRANQIIHPIQTCIRNFSQGMIYPRK